jgi:hypothetical protein
MDEIVTKIEQRKNERKALDTTVNAKTWYRFSWSCVRCRSKLTKVRNSDPDPEGKCPGCGKVQRFV